MDSSDFQSLKSEIWEIVFHAVTDSLDDVYGMNPVMCEELSYAAADGAERELKRIETLSDE